MTTLMTLIQGKVLGLLQVKGEASVRRVDDGLFIVSSKVERWCMFEASSASAEFPVRISAVEMIESERPMAMGLDFGAVTRREAVTVLPATDDEWARKIAGR